MLYITDIRTFLIVAKEFGYTLIGDKSVKLLYYNEDCYDEINVDLKSGEISIVQWCNNIKYYPPPNYQHYLLKDIDYLIKEKQIKKLKEQGEE